MLFIAVKVVVNSGQWTFATRYLVNGCKTVL